MSNPLSGPRALTRLALSLGVLAVFLLTGNATPAAAETTVLVLDSQPGEYVGQGLQQTFTTLDGSFAASGAAGVAHVSFLSPSHFWFMDFAATPGGTLVPGAYVDAQRWPFQSPTQPALSVAGDGNGCNTLSGRFVLYELVLNSSGNVLRLAADFEQHCDGEVPALFGSIRINSNVSIQPRVAIGGRALLEGDAGSSEAAFTLFLTHPATVPVGATFATADGSAHAGADYIATAGSLVLAPGEVARTISVVVPTNLTAQPDRQFSVQLTNATGAPIGASTASATILDDDSGRNLLYLDSQPFDYIGRGARRTLTELDGKIDGTLIDGHAAVRFSGPALDSWTVDLAAPSGFPLAPGVYENAERWPFQPSTEPGLDVSGGGAGCNTLSGRFVLEEIEADGDGNLLRLAADFEQHCEGGSAALFGSIRLHSTVPVVQQLPVVGDFNGDGKTDLLWRDSASGGNIAWLMNGPLLSDGVVLTPVTDGHWTIAGTADVNGDGETDILWRNAVDGAAVAWFMNDTSITAGAVLPAVSDPAWTIAATGRFDADGWPDVVWRNQSTGDNVIWFMRGATILGGAVLTQVPDPHWRIVGAGDADGDGHTDLFWRNDTTGDDAVWLMNGTSINAVVALPAVQDPNWTIEAVGDFNGDGRPDFVWRNRVTGENTIWLMNGIRRIGFVFLPTVADTTWDIRGPR